MIHILKHLEPEINKCTRYICSDEHIDSVNCSPAVVCFGCCTRDPLARARVSTSGTPAPSLWPCSVARRTSCGSCYTGDAPGKQGIHSHSRMCSARTGHLTTKNHRPVRQPNQRTSAKRINKPAIKRNNKQANNKLSTGWPTTNQTD